MSKMSEKVAYLKGLAEGLGVKDDTEQGKLMLAMIETLEAFAQQQKETEEELQELQEYVEEIDNDVSEIEEALFSVEDDEDSDEDDDEEDDEVLIPSAASVLFPTIPSTASLFFL